MRTVRRARSGDAPTLDAHRRALLAEHGQTLHPSYLAWLEASDPSDDSLHWMAEQDGQTLGSVGVSRWSWAPSTHPGGRGVFLYGLYVEPHARREGVATDLLFAVHEWARADGADSITLLQGPLTGELYPKHGYKLVSRWFLLQMIGVLLWALWSNAVVTRKP